MLEILQLKHNSKEWLEFRRTGIGGSDAAAIIGKSPFKSNVRVWEEKTERKKSEDISFKPEVKYGKKVEDSLVYLFACDFPQYKVKTDKKTVYKRGFMFASLDAELIDDSGRKGILEVKTNEIHALSDFEKWDKQIPEYYYVQILHYLIVTGWDFVVLKAQLKRTYPTGDVELITKHYKFERSEVLQDLRYLYEEEFKFWQYVCKNLRPPCRLPAITMQKF